MAHSRILIVDDDPSIIKALGMFFKHEGLATHGCPTGQEGLETAGRGDFDLVLLDIDLPDIDGFTVLERLRAQGNTTPVIIVSGHDEEYNKLVGLGSGADDYITKPFSMPLLLSKIRALIRRSTSYAAPQETGSAPELACGPLHLNRSTYRITRDGRPIDLTARELALLTVFMEHPGRVFTKAQLYQAVWNNPVVDENAVMVYVKRLRNKIEDNPSEPVYLQTLRGIGYRLACAE